MTRTFLLALLVLLAPAALAQRGLQSATVEAVQAPAWLDRGSAVRALAPGTTLQAGDRLRTGPGARVLVKSADGSQVKLGENARLEVDALSTERDGLFRATLKVLEGAFRFTTDAAAKLRRREVSITVGTVVAGIRGTDLWGKSTPGREVVCLIEGRIEVGADGEPPLTLDQPRQFYNRVDGKALPLGFVDAAQLKQWSAETDIPGGQGAVDANGKWTLVLARADEDSARAVQQGLSEAGYAAQRVSIVEGGQRAFEVRITGFATKDEAEAVGNRLKGRSGIVEPRVTN